MQRLDIIMKYMSTVETDFFVNKEFLYDKSVNQTYEL